MKEIAKSKIVCGYCLNDLAEEVDQHNESVCPDCSQYHYETTQSIMAHETQLAEENYFGHPEMVPTETRNKISVGDIIKIKGEKHLVTNE